MSFFSMKIAILLIKGWSLKIFSDKSSLGDPNAKLFIPATAMFDSSRPCNGLFRSRAATLD